MRNAIFGLLMCIGNTLLGQVIVDRNMEWELMHVFDPKSVSNNWIVPMDKDMREMPKPSGLNDKLTKKLDHQRMLRMQKGLVRHANVGNTRSAEAFTPEQTLGIDNLTGSGTPNDNHVAVGNNGMVVAVLNTVVRMYDSVGNRLLPATVVLDNFATKNAGTNVDTIPAMNRTYDPRVIYCPDEDRFILFFMHGTSDTTSFIVVGFSSSNNPTDPWYVYKVPGSPTMDKAWSDYPIVSQTSEDVFFTVNLLLNGTSWEEGFTEAVIWQLNKSDGFAGRKIGSNLFRNIKFEGVSIWSICPIQNGPHPGGTDNYFMSVRPYSERNDTVFLHRITNTQRSGKAEYELQVLRSDKPYGYPPSALQRDTSFKLRTNDVRVLSGLRVGNQIQYLQNCINFNTFQAHVAHSTIYNLGTSAFVRSKMITDDSLDFGYPAIAGVGKTDADPSSIITMVYTGPYHYAGTGVIFSDRYGEYSNFQKVKTGTSLINYSFIPKNEQRWGDYEGIQRKYNEPDVFYLIGSYGGNGNRMMSWVSKVKVTDGVWQTPVEVIKVFPVPAQLYMDLEWQTTEEGEYTFDMFGMDGKKAGESVKLQVKAGTHLYRLNTENFAPGVYVMHVNNSDKKRIFTQTIEIN